MKILIATLALCIAFVGTQDAKIISHTYQNPYVTYTTESTDGAPNKINILSLNVFMLSINVLGVPVPAGTEPFITKRAELLVPHLKGYDVIVFSELFDAQARRIILEGAKKQGYKYATGILGSGNDTFMKFGLTKKAYHKTLYIPIIHFEDPRFGKDKVYTQGGDPVWPWGVRDGKPVIKNGGIIIVSKYPIVQANCMFFEECRGWDCSAKKGVVYAKINKDGKMYHVFGTHPQCSNNAAATAARISQFKALARMIEGLDIPKDDPVIVAGDLNLGQPENRQYCFDLLGAKAPELRGQLHYSAHTPHMELKRFVGQSTPSLLDYVLYVSTHQLPKKSFNEIRPLYSPAPWGIRIDPKDTHEEPKFIKYNVRKRNQGTPVSNLSDHHAVYGCFEF